MQKLTGITLAALMLFAGGCKDDETTEAPAAGACPGDVPPDANGECQPPMIPTAAQPGQNGGGSGGGMPGMDGGDDGADGGDDSGHVIYEPDPGVGLAIPGLSRNVYVDDEVAARTVAIVSFRGDLLECSVDGGSTFAPCESTKELVWEIANYNVKHVLRATETKDGVTKSISASFTPSEEFPDMKFVSCDVTVSSSSSIGDFAAAADLAGSNVVCIEDGVIVAPDAADYLSTTTMQLQSDGMVFIARENDSVTFTTDNALIFDTNGFDDAMFVGLTLRDTTGNNVVSVKKTGADPSNNIVFDDVIVTCNGNQTGHCIHVQGSGSVSEPVRITNSVITRDNAGNGAPVYADGSIVTIGHSTLQGAYHALLGYGGSTIAAYKSTMTTSRTSKSASVGVISAYRDSNIILDSSTVISSGDYAVTLGSFNETVGTTLETSKSTFKRNDTDGGADVAAFYLGSGSLLPIVDSNENGNLFCNMAAATTAGDLTAIFDAGGSANSGNFAAPLQVNGGAIGTCP